MTTAFFRTLILYFILMTGLRLMGKRQIGELEPSELVLTLIISDLAAVPMQDFGIPLVNGLFPIITLLCLSMKPSVILDILLHRLFVWNDNPVFPDAALSVNVHFTPPVILGCAGRQDLDNQCSLFDDLTIRLEDIFERVK